MAETKNWTYEEVVPYSAPLTKSAINRQPSGVHDEYVDIMVKALRFRMTEHPGACLMGFTFKEECCFYNMQLKTSPLRADLYYDDTALVILGEAKVNKGDLCDRHTITQLLGYAAELDSPIHATKDKYIAICTPFNIGGIARRIVLDEIRPRISSNIGILFITEYDGKIIPAPEGWEDCDFSETRNTFVQSAKYGMIPVVERWVDVDELLFDPENSRLLGVQSAYLSQGQCWERLLADGDSADTDSAISRRSQMMIGSIREPIWITSDNIVHVGNSRTAYSKYACEMTNGHALGYSKLLAYDFGDADPLMLFDIKQEEQAMEKLDQGRVHDAMDMWRRNKQRGQSLEELYNDIFNRRYEKTIIEMSIATVEWLVNNGYNTDKDVLAMYWPAFPIVSIAWTRINKKLSTNGITCKSIIDAIAKAADPVWRTRKGADRLAKAIQDPQAPDWKIEALKGFLLQREGWSDTKDWDASYKEESEKHRYTAQMAARQLNTAITSIANSKREVEHTLSTLRAANASKSRVNAKAAGIYSKNALEDLQGLAADLGMLLDEFKASLSDASVEYARNKKNK